MAEELLFGRLDHGGTVRVTVRKDKESGEDVLDFEYLPPEKAKSRPKRIAKTSRKAISATKRKALPKPPRKKKGGEGKKPSGPSPVPSVPLAEEE